MQAKRPYLFCHVGVWFCIARARLHVPQFSTTCCLFVAARVRAHYFIPPCRRLPCRAAPVAPGIALFAFTALSRTRARTRAPFRMARENKTTLFAYISSTGVSHSIPYAFLFYRARALRGAAFWLPHHAFCCARRRAINHINMLWRFGILPARHHLLCAACCFCAAFARHNLFVLPVQTTFTYPLLSVVAVDYLFYRRQAFCATAWPCVWDGRIPRYLFYPSPYHTPPPPFPSPSHAPMACGGHVAFCMVDI